jgi:hypothetical protein
VNISFDKTPVVLDLLVTEQYPLVELALRPDNLDRPDEERGLDDLVRVLG